ncbi:MAG: PucR family transcriptional regulator, partial [Acidimicrobiia bacterium]
MTVPAVSSTPWQRLPLELGPALRSRLDATVRAIADQITAAIPGVADNAQLADNAKLAMDVQRGVRVALERFLELVGTDDAALPARVRETFVELGAAEAREDRTTETLLSA